MVRDKEHSRDGNLAVKCVGGGSSETERWCGGCTASASRATEGLGGVDHIPTLTVVIIVVVVVVVVAVVVGHSVKMNGGNDDGGTVYV